MNILVASQRLHERSHHCYSYFICWCIYRYKKLNPWVLRKTNLQLLLSSNIIRCRNTIILHANFCNARWGQAPVFWCTALFPCASPHLMYARPSLIESRLLWKIKRTGHVIQHFSILHKYYFSHNRNCPEKVSATETCVILP